jgi:hypothetical protein
MATADYAPGVPQAIGDGLFTSAEPIQPLSGVPVESSQHSVPTEDNGIATNGHSIPTSSLPTGPSNEVAPSTNGVGNGPQIQSTSEGLEVVCGPLLNYRHMSGENTDNPIWHGSVLVVSLAGNIPGKLSLQQAGAGAGAGSRVEEIQGMKLYEDEKSAFWQFSLAVPFLEQEAEWQYIIPSMRTKDGKNVDKPTRFFVPSKEESMRIMFHSCNGFSVGTDEEAWSGPALWNDVLRVHGQRPFHVMIGGGDQIYNDSVRVSGPLKPWTDIGNPERRRHFPFGEDMRAQCDEFYFNNYVKWYGMAPFSTANGQIPQLNIWDDHDIIDGFGSYTDHFMRAPVFRGIGGVAHKYYMLFQHHLPPPVSTYTTDAPQTTGGHAKSTPADPTQLNKSFVAKLDHEDPSYILGKTPGPYVEERSRHIFCQLGKRMAFLGIDARTERTRHQINYPETYKQIWDHVDAHVTKSNGAIRHLVLLLGVPIAYPRLQWLENILRSPIIGPLRFLNKRFGVAGSFFNQFDGGVDLLDDLDDHYTAGQHKKERKELIHSLQALSKKHSMRITILGGDVHLAALGRFYSKPELNIAAEADWRYMPNIVSSAITNKPPPTAVANLLAKRNKIHHLDHDTHETLLELFNKNPGVGEPGVKPKSADNNKATMPSRNYAIITESHSHSALTNGAQTNGVQSANGVDATTFTAPKNPREPLHPGEVNAGTDHAAAQGITRTNLAGADGLDVTIRVEKNPSDREGHTEGYGFSIPALDMAGYKAQGEKW